MKVPKAMLCVSFFGIRHVELRLPFTILTNWVSMARQFADANLR